jgi:hypothetical protein
MSIGKRSKSQVEKSRPIVYKRDRRECVVSGTFEAVRWPCAGGLTVQHRRGKGMGGSALGDDPEGLVSMCQFHNVLQTADHEFALVCTKFGWSVPRWAADQYKLSQIPVFYADGWHLLSGNSRFTIPESTAQAVMVEVYGDLFV